MLPRSFGRSWIALLITAASSAGVLACGSSPPASGGGVGQPSPADCPGAIAELETGFAVDVYNWRPITVDSEGILIDVEAVANSNPFLISGTVKGDFAPWSSSPTQPEVGVSGDAVFVATTPVDGGTELELEEIPRSGGATTAIAQVDVGIYDLAATPSTLYLATDIGIEAIPRDGGAATLVYDSASSASGTAEEPPVTLLALDGSTLVWSEGGLASDAPFAIRSATVDGPFTPTTLATLPAGEGIANMAAANGAVLYLTTARNADRTFTHSLYLLAASSSTPALVDAFSSASGATPTAGALPLAIGNGAAYYSFDGSLKRVALDGSNAITTLTAPGSDVSSVGASPEGDVVYAGGRCIYAEKG